MKKIILVLVLVLVFNKDSYSTTIEDISKQIKAGIGIYSDRYVFIARDTFGCSWYLDKQDIHILNKTTDFHIAMAMNSSHGQTILVWLSKILQNQQQAYEILNHTLQIAHKYIFDLEQASFFSRKHLFLWSKWRMSI